MHALQVVENHDHSKAADVYSFGIIMWEMMTWDMPWEELNPFQVSHLTEYEALLAWIEVFNPLCNKGVQLSVVLDAIV